MDLYLYFGCWNHWVLFSIYVIPHLPHLFQELIQLPSSSKNRMLDFFFLISGISYIYLGLKPGIRKPEFIRVEPVSDPEPKNLGLYPGPIC